jgi:integrase/recombinase XerD
MTPFEQVARAHANSRGAQGTRDLYNADLDAWLKFCAEESITPSKPTLAGASAYRDLLMESHAALTVRRTLAALSSMYEAALGLERPLATWNPFKRLPRPPATDYAKTEVFTDAEAKSIIAKAETVARELTQGVRDVAILRLLYDTGLRVSAVVTLRRDHVFRRGEKLCVRVVVKGGKEVVVELTDEAATALQRWLDRGVKLGEYVFPARGGRLPMSRTAINRRITFYATAVGIAHAHPHRFRATFITDALDTLPLHEVQAAVHHADPATTLRYDRRKRGTGVTSAVAAARAKKGGSVKGEAEG